MRSKRTYKNISNSTYFNDIVQTLKAQKSKSALKFNSIKTRSLEHIFCFLSELLFRHRFTLSADLRRQPLLGARGKITLLKSSFLILTFQKMIFFMYFLYSSFTIRTFKK